MKLLGRKCVLCRSDYIVAVVESGEKHQFSIISIGRGTVAEPVEPVE